MVRSGPEVYYTVSSYANALAWAISMAMAKPTCLPAMITAPGFIVLLGGAFPDLAIAVTHGGGFTQGQVGRLTRSRSAT